MAEEMVGKLEATGKLTKAASDRQPILSLVQREYLKSVGNIPRSMWEAMSYLYSEADKSLLRIEAMDIPADAEEALKRIPMTKGERKPIKGGTEEVVRLVAAPWWAFWKGPQEKTVKVQAYEVVQRALTVEERQGLMGYWRAVMETRQSAIKNWHQVLGWLDELLVESQSVDALRSWQLMTGLQPNNSQPRASAAMMPDFPQPQPPGQPAPRGGGKRGLRL